MHLYFDQYGTFRYYETTQEPSELPYSGVAPSWWQVENPDHRYVYYKISESQISSESETSANKNNRGNPPQTEPVEPPPIVSALRVFETTQNLEPMVVNHEEDLKPRVEALENIIEQMTSV